MGGLANGEEEEEEGPEERRVGEGRRGEKRRAWESFGESGRDEREEKGEGRDESLR